VSVRAWRSQDDQLWREEAVTVTHSDHFTLADLENTPDDGRRYEVINGTLVVTPAPFMPHNRRSQALGLALLDAVPNGMEVMLTGTLGVQLGEDLLIPDAVVYRVGDYPRNLPVEAVVLVVEVTSPSNRSNDTVLKLDRYARAGVPHYWVVDPDVITVFELVDGTYREVTSGPSIAVEQPFPVDVQLV
jgi:Uma2 family endonuclease